MQAYETLRPAKAVEGATEDVAAAAAGGGDIAAALASEVAELKDESKQLFVVHPSGLKSVVYLEYRGGEDDPTPTELTLAICREAQATQQSRTRFICRFHPVDYQCYASMEKIEELAEKVVEKHFPEGAELIKVGRGRQGFCQSAGRHTPGNRAASWPARSPGTAVVSRSSGRLGRRAALAATMPAAAEFQQACSSTAQPATVFAMLRLSLPTSPRTPAAADAVFGAVRAPGRAGPGAHGGD